MPHRSSTTQARPPERADLARLYETDETAWLEESSRLIRRGDLQHLDYDNLASYLEDMARRDKREVESRLATLIMHILKWVHQPHQRSKSWERTIKHQRRELKKDLVGVLRRHADDVLAECYREAADDAADETGLPISTFPTECPYTLDWILTEKLL
jgi:hypothetical protein